MQHAADGAEALILALAEMTPAVKLAEQLVRAVDEMNDQAAASCRMIVHLIDGTYELFRQFYGRRHFSKGKDERFGAVSGVLHSILEMIETGGIIVGVSTDLGFGSFHKSLVPDTMSREVLDNL